MAMSLNVAGGSRHDYEMLMEFIVFLMQKDIPPTKGKKATVGNS